jgi:hypothetical protein
MVAIKYHRPKQIVRAKIPPSHEKSSTKSRMADRTILREIFFSKSVVFLACQTATSCIKIGLAVFSHINHLKT